MVMLEQELFGAPLGDLRALSLMISWLDDGQGEVVVFVHQRNRSALLKLRVTFSSRDQVAHIVGSVIPLLQRCSMMSVRAARASMWAIHNRMGKEGFEVHIENCGKSSKR